MKRSDCSEEHGQEQAQNEFQPVEEEAEVVAGRSDPVAGAEERLGIDHDGVCIGVSRPMQRGMPVFAVRV